MIVREVNTRTAEIDEFVGRIRDGIERLKELRTALISAAVTGKLDVRDECLMRTPAITKLVDGTRRLIYS